MINLANPIEENTLTARTIRELARKAVDGDVPGTKVIRHFLTNTTDSTAISSTNSEMNFDKNVVLSKSIFELKRTIKLRAGGVYSSTATPTLIFKVKLGTTALITFTARTAINNASNQSWAIEAELIPRSLGATGTLQCDAVLRINTSAGVDTSETVVNSSPVTVNLNAVNNLQISLTWSAADAANTSTLKKIVAEVSDYA